MSLGRRQHRRYDVSSEITQSVIPPHVRDNAPEMVKLLETFLTYLEVENKSAYYLNNVIDSRDIDTTDLHLLELIKTDIGKFIPSQYTESDDALVYKNILDLYKSKGTAEAMHAYFRIFHSGDKLEVHYPKVDMLKPSDGKWFNARQQHFENISDFTPKHTYSHSTVEWYNDHAQFVTPTEAYRSNLRIHGTQGKSGVILPTLDDDGRALSGDDIILSVDVSNAYENAVNDEVMVPTDLWNISVDAQSLFYNFTGIALDEWTYDIPMIEYTYNYMVDVDEEKNHVMVYINNKIVPHEHVIGDETTNIYELKKDDTSGNVYLEFDTVWLYSESDGSDYFKSLLLDGSTVTSQDVISIVSIDKSRTTKVLGSRKTDDGSLNFHLHRYYYELEDIRDHKIEKRADAWSKLTTCDLSDEHWIIKKYHSSLASKRLIDYLLHILNPSLMTLALISDTYEHATSEHWNAYPPTLNVMGNPISDNVYDALSDVVSITLAKDLSHSIKQFSVSDLLKLELAVQYTLPSDKFLYTDIGRGVSNLMSLNDDRACQYPTRLKDELSVLVADTRGDDMWDELYKGDHRTSFLPYNGENSTTTSVTTEPSNRPAEIKNHSYATKRKYIIDGRMNKGTIDPEIRISDDYKVMELYWINNSMWDNKATVIPSTERALTVIDKYVLENIDHPIIARSCGVRFRNISDSDEAQVVPEYTIPDDLPYNILPLIVTNTPTSKSADSTIDATVSNVYVSDWDAIVARYNLKYGFGENEKSVLPFMSSDLDGGIKYKDGVNAENVKNFLSYKVYDVGSYSSNDGFLSATDKIQDSFFYQTFSYVLRTASQIETWEPTFTKLLHPAGFKFFGETTFIYDENMDIPTDQPGLQVDGNSKEIFINWKHEGVYTIEYTIVNYDGSMRGLPVVFSKEFIALENSTKFTKTKEILNSDNKLEHRVVNYSYPEGTESIHNIDFGSFVEVSNDVISIHSNEINETGGEYEGRNELISWDVRTTNPDHIDGYRVGEQIKFNDIVWHDAEYKSIAGLGLKTSKSNSTGTLNKKNVLGQGKYWKEHKFDHTESGNYNWAEYKLSEADINNKDSSNNVDCSIEYYSVDTETNTLIYTFDSVEYWEKSRSFTINLDDISPSPLGINHNDPKRYIHSNRINKNNYSSGSEVSTTGKTIYNYSISEIDGYDPTDDTLVRIETSDGINRTLNDNEYILTSTDTHIKVVTLNNIMNQTTDKLILVTKYQEVDILFTNQRRFDDDKGTNSFDEIPLTNVASADKRNWVYQIPKDFYINIYNK
jgi:hypothetical protein